MYVVPTFIATKFFVHRDIKGVYIYEKNLKFAPQTRADGGGYPAR